jgi:hypothetical protein
MPNPQWVYRFVHLSISGAVYAYEECGHGVIFCRSFDGSARGSICIDDHVFEWLDTWTEVGSDDIHLRETVLVNGRPVSERFSPLVREYIAARFTGGQVPLD